MTLPILRSALALLAAAVLTAGASAQSPLTIEDLFEIRQAGGAAISPDGQSVAYTVTVPRNAPGGDADGVPHVELHIATGANQSRAYVAGEGRVSAIAWTPDGQGVTFLANRAGDSATALYRIDVAGARPSASIRTARRSAAMPSRRTAIRCSSWPRTGPIRCGRA